MSLPLCLPEKLDCVQNIKATYEECLPQCSGVWITNYEGKKYEEIRDNPDYNVDKKISKLSAQYWNYKGFHDKFKDFPKGTFAEVSKSMFICSTSVAIPYVPLYNFLFVCYQ